MARRKRPKSATTTRKPKPSRWSGLPLPRLTPPQLKRGMLVAGWTALLVGVGAAWSMGVPRLEAYAADRIVTHHVEIEFIGARAWLLENESIHRQLEVAVLQHLRGTALEADSLHAARAALEATGWFERVDQLVRTDLGRIEVHGVYMQPFAVIRNGFGHHVVDRQGRILPKQLPLDQTVDLPSMSGVRFGRPDALGSVWPGTDVAAGLRLIEVIDRQLWSHQVSAVDVSEYTSNQSLWLRTKRGGRIQWGRSPGEERGAEVPTEQKLRYLDELFARSGSIDGLRSELHIMHDRVYTRW